MHGTNRPEAGYVHCTIGGTTSINELASWWLMGGFEQWSAIYALARAGVFDHHLVDASKVTIVDSGGATRQALFFLCADGKAQILLSGCKNKKAEFPNRIVCWAFGRNRAYCLANLGTKQTIQRMSDADLRTNAVYRHNSTARRIPDYWLHAVMRVCICGIYGMRDAVVVATGKSPAMVARTLLQPMLHVVRLAAKTCTRGITILRGPTKRGRSDLNVQQHCTSCGTSLRSRLTALVASHPGLQSSLEPRAESDYLLEPY